MSVSCQFSIQHNSCKRIWKQSMYTQEGATPHCLTDTESQQRFKYYIYLYSIVTHKNIQMFFSVDGNIKIKGAAFGGWGFLVLGWFFFFSFF